MKDAIILLRFLLMCFKDAIYLVRFPSRHLKVKALIINEGLAKGHRDPNFILEYFSMVGRDASTSRHNGDLLEGPLSTILQ